MLRNFNLIHTRLIILHNICSAENLILAKIFILLKILVLVEILILAEINLNFTSPDQTVMPSIILRLNQAYKFICSSFKVKCQSSLMLRAYLNICEPMF